MPALDQYVVYGLDEAGELRPLASDEAFVVRQSDVFGTSALFAYAHLIHTALELDLSRGFLAREERRSLVLLADDIHETAVRWMATSGRKLPE